MGGYVASLTPIRHPKTRNLIPNIITLATPHSNPLYAFDESIVNIHRQITTAADSSLGDDNNGKLQFGLVNTLFISISAGLRDEMIDPAACKAPHSFTALSVSVRCVLVHGDFHRGI